MSSTLVTMTCDDNVYRERAMSESRRISFPLKVFGGEKSPPSSIKISRPDNFLNHLCYRNFYAGERRNGVGGNCDIIESDNRHLLWHRYAALVQRFDRTYRHIVVTGN